MRRDVSVRELPTGERMRIVKHRYMPVGLSEAEVSCLPRACIVTGMHGDELEGQYVIYELVRRLQSQPQNLAGVVDVYPAVNPMGMGAIERGIPQFDLDMDRIFPGSHDASPFEAMAADLVEDVRGAQVAFDLHASSIYLRSCRRSASTRSRRSACCPSHGRPTSTTSGSTRAPSCSRGPSPTA